MTRDPAIQHRRHLPTLMAQNRLASIVLFVAVILLLTLASRGQTEAPLTLDQVRSLIGIGAPDATIAHEIESRGAAFHPSSTLLNKLEGDGAGVQTLAALRKLIPAEHTICESFGGCMSGGQHAFHEKKWDDAKAYFEQAATISPNSGQAWNSLGKTYLALRQTQGAYAAWDKALNSEDGVALTACMESRRPICEGGTLRLNATTLFRYKGDETIFEVPLSAVRIVGAISHGSPSYLTFEMLVNGTKYGFDFFPITVNCVWTNVLVCPVEGKIEQTAMGGYFEQTIRRLAAGGTGGIAIAPRVESPEQRDIPQVKIGVWHRHSPIGLVFSTPQQSTYCQGVLTVYSGIVQYDCTMPDRTSGRCEHAMISPVRSVEYKNGGLKVVGKGGNWNFFGNNSDLKRAHDAIAATLALQK